MLPICSMNCLVKAFSVPVLVSSEELANNASTRTRNTFAGKKGAPEVAALMAKSDVFSPLRYCGRHSIVIYLAFFLPMAATRIALFKSGIVTDMYRIRTLLGNESVVLSVLDSEPVREMRAVCEEAPKAIQRVTSPSTTS